MAEPRHALSDGQAVVLALLTWVGATSARSLPLALAGGVIVLALSLRRSWLLLLGGLLLGSTLGARAVAGLDPVSPAPFSGTVTLVSDPENHLGTTAADIQVDGRRLELRARSAGRGELLGRLAGERVTVRGHIRPPPPDSPWLDVRHVVGRLDADSVRAAGPGAAPFRAANRLRRLLVEGAESLSPERRALFLGFVLGDDREQPETVADDFRGAGLTHLLAVSGENVAFVIVLTGPLLRRMRLWPRWATTLAVIGFFALITRFEPSVLRAGAMAGLTATAFVLGRPASGVRLLALAVTALVLVDPLLVRSVGFRLSVAASAGILVIAPALRRLLPGPGLLVEPLAVTAGAQLAVAPLMVATFGGIPVSSLPANLLAGPAAGLIMTWGLGAGIPAGLIDGQVAMLLHTPTSALIAWVATVARLGSTVPLGELGAGHLGCLGAALGVAVLGRHLRLRAARVLAGVAVLCVLLTPALALRREPAHRVSIASGIELWRSDGATVLIVDGWLRPDDLLEALRRVGVRRVDLLVAVRGGAADAEVSAAVAHRWPPTQIWAPEGHRVPDATVPEQSSALRLGGLIIAVETVRPTLVVTVSDPSHEAAGVRRKRHAYAAIHAAHVGEASGRARCPLAPRGGATRCDDLGSDARGNRSSPRRPSEAAPTHGKGGRRERS